MFSNSDIASDVVNARVAAIGASLLCLAWIVKQVQIRRRLSDIPTAVSNNPSQANVGY
jgi:hypothetical protein